MCICHGMTIASIVLVVGKKMRKTLLDINNKIFVCNGTLFIGPNGGRKNKTVLILLDTRMAKQLVFQEITHFWQFFMAKVKQSYSGQQQCIAYIFSGTFSILFLRSFKVPLTVPTKPAKFENSSSSSSARRSLLK